MKTEREYYMELTASYNDLLASFQQKEAQGARIQEAVDVLKAAQANAETDKPETAEKLAIEFIESADRLVDFPYANPIYQTKNPLKQEYRKLKVRNYIMFYWVNEVEKRIIIARVIYSRRDYENML